MPSRCRSRHRLLILRCLRHQRQVMRMAMRIRAAHVQNMMNGYRLAAMTRQMDAYSAAFSMRRTLAAAFQEARSPTSSAITQTDTCDADSTSVQRPRTCSSIIQTDALHVPVYSHQQLSVAVQTDPGAWQALVEEVHCSNARRFRAEAALIAARLPLVPANYRG